MQPQVDLAGSLSSSRRGLDVDGPDDGIFRRSPPLFHHEDLRWSLTLHGIAWLPGCRHGPESLEALADRLARTPVPAAVGELRGVFALHLFDRHRREGWWTVDGAGLFRLFVTPGYIGPDLLAAASSLPDPRRAVDAERFLQILAYDAPLDGGTLFSGVRVLGADEVLHLAADGRRTSLEKDGFGPVVEDVGARLRGEMRALATALAGEAVEAGLTGGLDSRLLVLLAGEAGLPLSTALAGPADGPEARIAAEVARRLGLPFRVVPQDVSRLPGELDEILARTRGLASPLAFHPDWCLLRDRLARGIGVVLHGIGGELLRDFLFVQELPFLWTGGRVDLERLWRLRILRRPIPPEHLPAPLAARARTVLWEHFRKTAAAVGGRGRIERVVRIALACRYRHPVGHLLSAHTAAGLPALAPYLDRRVVEAALRTPPRQLVLQWPIRKLATEIDPAVAAIPTVHGFTASAAPRHLLPDLLRRLRFESQRAFGRLVRWRRGGPIVRTSAFHLAAHPDFHRILQESGVVEAAVRTLADAGLLAPRAAPERLPASWHAPLVQVAKLLEHFA